MFGGLRESVYQIGLGVSTQKIVTREIFLAGNETGLSLQGLSTFVCGLVAEQNLVSASDAEHRGELFDVLLGHLAQP